MSQFLKIIAFIYVVTLFSCNEEKSATISGNIKGLGNDTIKVIVIPFSDNPSIVDTIVSKNGKFSIENKANEPSTIRIFANSMFFKRPGGRTLWMRSKMINFYSMPHEHIEITGKMYDYSVEYSVIGNNLAEQFSAFKIDNLLLLEDETKTYIELMKRQFEKASRSEIDSLNQRFGEIRNHYTQVRFDYAKNNPKNELSAIFLGYQYRDQEIDTIIKYYDLLSDEVKNTWHGRKLAKRIDGWRRIKIGNKAPDFTAKLITGDTLKLSDYYGKYLVLDFWGSWCGPCIAGFPKMKEYYQKYKDKIEIIGIACNDEKNDWSNAVKNYGINWLHTLNDNEYLSINIEETYAIEGFPTKILVNEKGEIEGIFVGEYEDFYKKLDNLFYEE